MLISVVEDNEQDIRLLARALKRANVDHQLQIFSTGEEFISYVSNPGNQETLKNSPVLVDLNLPGVSGWDVISHIKTHDLLKSLPTIVLTSSSDSRDVALAYQCGANSYIVKPVDTVEYYEAIQAFVRYWLNINEYPSLANA